MKSKWLFVWITGIIFLLLLWYVVSLVQTLSVLYIGIIHCILWVFNYHFTYPLALVLLIYPVTDVGAYKLPAPVCICLYCPLLVCNKHIVILSLLKMVLHSILSLGLKIEYFLVSKFRCHRKYFDSGIWKKHSPSPLDTEWCCVAGFTSMADSLDSPMAQVLAVNTTTVVCYTCLLYLSGQLNWKSSA